MSYLMIICKIKILKIYENWNIKLIDDTPQFFIDVNVIYSSVIME